MDSYPFHSYKKSHRFPGTALASRFNPSTPLRIQIADNMPQVTVQMTIFMQKPKSLPVNPLSPPFSMNLLMHRMKLIAALMTKWAVRAARSGVLSVKVKRIEPMMELTYIHTKKSSKAMYRTSGMNGK